MKHRCTIKLIAAGLAMSVLPGCELAVPYLETQCNCFLTPCELSEARIQIVDGAEPVVSDQRIEGCIDVSVMREYADDHERSLILKAESLASKVGPTWVSQIRKVSLLDANGAPLFPVAAAVNSEALEYYANRVREFQENVNPNNPRIRLNYFAAHFLGESRTGNGSNVPLVYLSLFYEESYGGPLSSGGFGAWRGFEFDQDDNVVSIDGDDLVPHPGPIAN